MLFLKIYTQIVDRFLEIPLTLFNNILRSKYIDPINWCPEKMKKLYLNFLWALMAAEGLAQARKTSVMTQFKCMYGVRIWGGKLMLSQQVV